MAKSKKKSCIMYGEWLELLKDEDLCLSDAEIGIVMVAVLEYIQSGIIPKFSDRGLTAVFKTIKGQIDKDGEKYDETCKKRKQAIGKRWNDTKNTNEYKSIEKNTSDTDNDNDCDNEDGHNSLSESMCVDVHMCAHEDRKDLAPCGFFRNVYLTGDEIKALEAEIGADKLGKAIMKLSTEIEKTGKYKNEKHAATIRSWVLEAIDEAEVRELERNGRRKRASGSRDAPDEKAERAKKAGFDFELEDICEKPSRLFK